MSRLLIIILCFVMFLTPTLAQTKSKTATKKPTSSRTVTQRKKTTRNTNTKQSTKTKTKTKTKTAKAQNSKTTKPQNNKISGLRSEQEKIKRNIRKQEQALRANKAQVKEKLKNLMIINGEMDRRRQSIDSINHDINRIDNNISLLQSQLEELQSQLDGRKQEYMKSLRYMAKRRGIHNELMFIFSGKDFKQIYRRMRFMRQYAAYQRTQGKALQMQQQKVTDKREQLQQTRGEKSTLLRKGQKEHAALEGQKVEQQKVVSSLQKQQKTIQSVIDEQRKKDAAINAQIDRLVAEEVERARQAAIAEAKRKAEQAAEAKRKAELLAKKKAIAEAAARENARRVAEAKEAERRAKAVAKASANKNAEERARAEQVAREAESARIAMEKKARMDEERAAKEVESAKKASEEVARLSSADRLISGGFEANKGRLPSPLAGGRIVSHFGQHGVDGLPGVVLDNKGINILGQPGSVARSIYDGVVSAVFNAGGMMGVLVRHGAYISVYCNLSSVSVSRGQKVSARQALGTVGRDNILQFQLRRERDKLNPEKWIGR